MTEKELDAKALLVARENMGEFAWLTVLLAFVVIGGYFTVPWVVAIDALPLWLGVVLMAVFAYGSYTVLHESVHGSISGNKRSCRWLNNALGYLAACVTLVPLTAHRHEHIAHHRHTNDPIKDPDFKVSKMRGSFLNATRGAMSLIINQYHYYAVNCWPRASRSERLRFLSEIIVSLSLRIIFVVQGFWFEGFMLFIVGSTLGTVALVYLFAFIVHQPHTEEGRYLDTSTITVSGLLGKLVTALWLYQNYHSIHHLFPRVPFYKYTKVYEGIQDVMEHRNAPIYSLTIKGLERRQYEELTPNNS